MKSSHVASTERTFTVTDLLPATKYQLKVTAHNNAGSTTAIYDFTTLTAQGCRLKCDGMVMEREMESGEIWKKEMIEAWLLGASCSSNGLKN
jgi:hypothetical protein